MFKKFLAFLIALILIFNSSLPIFANGKNNINDFKFATEMNASSGEKDPSADSATAKNGGKVIVIDIDRTSLENFENIKFLKGLMNHEGYVGLMNIRGDKGYDDARNYATFGATGRVNIKNDEPLDFAMSSKKADGMYRAATGVEPGKINLLNINDIDLYNQTKGEYKSNMGYLADTLILDGKKIAALGNSDYYDDNGNYMKNRAFCLAVMDSKGRIHEGNIDKINKNDVKFPYGISIDYDKLIKYTEEQYKNNDLIFVDIGDTYRLDMYKTNLNSKTYKRMKFAIYNKISDYLKKVFEIANPNDTIYVISSFPSNLDYANNRRLSPVIRFDMSDKSKGILTSSTTRRDGVIANMDLGVDILHRFGMKNTEMLGKTLKGIKIVNNLEYIFNEYNKIVAVSSIRMSIINIYVTFISVSWVLAALAFWQRSKLSPKHRKKILILLKELVKFGLIMPLAFLTAPILRPSTDLKIALSIIIVSIIYYRLASKIFRGDDIMQIGFYSLAMIFLITIDSTISTPLMQSNIMSYDPMVGARYYGVGNEYEGVTIGSAILGFAVLYERTKIPKWFTVVMLMLILFISAYPGMGANVGGAISECVAYLFFVLLIYGVKLDLKNIIMVFVSAVLLVAGFAAADILFGLHSHLGNFVEMIKLNGPMEIVYVFTRKIAMNIQLAQTTVWVNILLVGLAILAFTIIRPNRSFTMIKKKYPIIYDGFLATIVGCVVTLLVNDSGIIAAATDSIYLLIPILIILINKGVKNLIC